MLLTKLGRPPAPAAANLLRAEGALAPPATGGNGRDRYGRAPPSGQARRRGAMAGWREMPRNSRRAVGPSSGRTAGWHGARLPLSLPEPTGLGKGPAAPAPGRVASLSVSKDQPAPLMHLAGAVALRLLPAGIRMDELYRQESQVRDW